MRQSIFGILLDCQMGKQREILQNISHSALGDWNIDVGGRVKQDAFINTAIRPASGVVSPATQSSNVVFPDPEGPNSMVNPGWAVKSTSSENLRSAAEKHSCECVRSGSDSVVFVPQAWASSLAYLTGPISHDFCLGVPGLSVLRFIP